MKDLRIGLIQAQQFWEDKTANLNHFESHFLNHIDANSVDLVLLPEMFNTSFSMNVASIAEQMDGASLVWLKTWAKKLNCQMGGSIRARRQAGCVYLYVANINETDIPIQGRRQAR